MERDPEGSNPHKRSAWILCNTVYRVNQVRIARRAPHSASSSLLSRTRPSHFSSLLFPPLTTSLPSAS